MEKENIKSVLIITILTFIGLSGIINFSDLSGNAVYTLTDVQRTSLSTALGTNSLPLPIINIVQKILAGTDLKETPLAGQTFSEKQMADDIIKHAGEIGNSGMAKVADPKIIDTDFDAKDANNNIIASFKYRAQTKQEVDCGSEAGTKCQIFMGSYVLPQGDVEIVAEIYKITSPVEGKAFRTMVQKLGQGSEPHEEKIGINRVLIIKPTSAEGFKGVVWPTDHMGILISTRGFLTKGVSDAAARTGVIGLASQYLDIYPSILIDRAVETSTTIGYTTPTFDFTTDASGWKDTLNTQYWSSQAVVMKGCDNQLIFGMMPGQPQSGFTIPPGISKIGFKAKTAMPNKMIIDSGLILDGKFSPALTLNPPGQKGFLITDQWKNYEFDTVALGGAGPQPAGSPPSTPSQPAGLGSLAGKKAGLTLSYSNPEAKTICGQTVNAQNAVIIDDVCFAGADGNCIAKTSFPVSSTDTPTTPPSGYLIVDSIESTYSGTNQKVIGDLGSTTD